MRSLPAIALLALACSSAAVAQSSLMMSLAYPDTRPVGPLVGSVIYQLKVDDSYGTSNDHVQCTLNVEQTYSANKAGWVLHTETDANMVTTGPDHFTATFTARKSGTDSGKEPLMATYSKKYGSVNFNVGLIDINGVPAHLVLDSNGQISTDDSPAAVGARIPNYSTAPSTPFHRAAQQSEETGLDGAMPLGLTNSGTLEGPWIGNGSSGSFTVPVIMSVAGFKPAYAETEAVLKANGTPTSVLLPHGHLTVKWSLQAAPGR